MNPAKNQTNERAINSREREGRVIEMRKCGLSYRQIGAQLHISAEAAWKIVKRVINRINEKTHEGAETVRQLELERLDEMFQQAWVLASAPLTQTVTTDDGEEREQFLEANLEAQKQVLRIMERRAHLLGLDAPKKVEVEDVTDIDAQLEALLARRIVKEAKSSRQVPAAVEITSTTEPVDSPREMALLAAPGRSRIRKDEDRR